MIRKVLCSTINYDHPQLGMLHAMRGIFGEQNVVDFDYLREQRLGVSVETINQEFVKAALAQQPDWIWLQAQDTGVLSPEAILEVRRALPHCVISHWTGDARPQVCDYLARICQATHLTLVSSVGALPIFRNAGAEEAQYLQIGLDWQEDVLGLPDWTPPFRVPEVVFIGTNYGATFPGTKDREDAIRALMQAGIDVGIVGNGWGSGWPVVGTCGVKQQHHVWKAAKVALSINNFNDIEGYYSDRQLIAMASGTPVVCKYIPGLEKEFLMDSHCKYYETTDRMLERVRWLLNNPEDARYLGQKGRAEVIRNHTWFSRFLGIIPTIERLQSGLQLGLA